MPNEREKQQAAKLMRHYFELVFNKAGLKWDSDNDSEIDELVECLTSNSTL